MIDKLTGIEKCWEIFNQKKGELLSQCSDGETETILKKLENLEMAIKVAWTTEQREFFDALLQIPLFQEAWGASKFDDFCEMQEGDIVEGGNLRKAYPASLSPEEKIEYVANEIQRCQNMSGNG